MASQEARTSKVLPLPVLLSFYSFLPESKFYSEALSVLTQTRQLTLLNAFMDALTRGGPGGLPRPIEIHAHDPLRYVGDMLAWVHQSIAGEREFLEGLFEVKAERRMVGSVRRFDGSEEETWIRDLMDRAYEKVRSPLRVSVLFLRKEFITLSEVKNQGAYSFL